MIDEIYRNAFKETYEILLNTENELLEYVPSTFIDFLKENMNENYKTNISLDIPIDKQPLLKETEALLSLIYRSYWATDEEVKEFHTKDQNESQDKLSNENDIYMIFEKRKNLNNVTINNDLIVVEKTSFLKELFKKILNIFKKN